MNKSQLSMKFYIANLNGNSMSMEFIQDDKSIEKFDNMVEGIFRWNHEINFPSVLRIKLSNKGKYDTQLDKDGKIIADKYIKLLDIVVDRLPCADYYVNRTKLVTDQNQEIYSDYWGFNGHVDLEFLQANSFLWSVDTQNRVNS